MRFVVLAVGVGALGVSQPADVGWPMHGGTNNIRHSPLTQINRSNVRQLRQAWTYDSKDAFEGSEMQSHPVVLDGTVYVTTPTMKVAAIDAAT
jgi:quinoprotein glucose dehydrogenase